MTNNDWRNSEEYQTAYANWCKKWNTLSHHKFEQSREYANARYLYKKRIEKDPI